jgi:hypothetical protein
MARFYIKGMLELKRCIARLGELPQRCVTPAAKAGATIALRAARKKAPFDTGELRKGIVLKGERVAIKGKKVSDVTMDKNKNDVFVKMSKDGKKRWYYPASQEYGFTVHGKYTPGYQFLKSSLEDNSTAIKEKTVAVLAKNVDKELKK